jgi:hypothetical protein
MREREREREREMVVLPKAEVLREQYTFLNRTRYSCIFLRASSFPLSGLWQVPLGIPNKPGLIIIFLPVVLTGNNKFFSRKILRIKW